MTLNVCSASFGCYQCGQKYGTTTWDGLPLMPKLGNDNSGWVHSVKYVVSGMTTRDEWDGMPLVANSSKIRSGWVPTVANMT
eukprot:5573255-Amphidinium_carterae.1